MISLFNGVMFRIEMLISRVHIYICVANMFKDSMTHFEGSTLKKGAPFLAIQILQKCTGEIPLLNVKHDKMTIHSPKLT